MKCYNNDWIDSFVLTICFICVFKNWHTPCNNSGIAGMVRRMTKEIKMTLSSRNQIASVFAAVVCAFITVGMSVAPAVAPVASLVA